MSELVKRLRFRVEFVNGGNGNVLELPDDLCVEAANYIEKLEGEARLFSKTHDDEVKRLCDEHTKELEDWQAERNVARGDQERAEDTLKYIYPSLWVLETMCKKAGLAYGAEQAREMRMEMERVMPELPALSALRLEAFTPSGADCHPESPHASTFRVKA